MCIECDKRDGTNFYAETHGGDGPDNASVQEKIVIPKEELEVQQEKVEAGEKVTGGGPQFPTPTADTPI